MSDVVSINVGDDVVKPIIEKQIQADIIAKLGNTDKFIEQVVSLALSKKVDDKGNVSTSSYENRNDLIEVLSRNAIAACAKEIINEWLSENKNKIKDALVKELNSPRRKKAITAAFLTAIERSFETRWTHTCYIKFEEE